MDVVFGLLLFVLVVGGPLVVVRRLLLCPTRLADWPYALAAALRDQRRPLHDARRRKWRTESEIRREIAAAKRDERDARKHVRALERRQRKYRHRKPGGQLGVLGGLVLCEHVLRVVEGPGRGDKPDEIPLLGLRAESKFLKTTEVIVLTLPGGTERLVPFPHHTDVEVARFAIAINNQAAAERDDRAWRDDRIEEVTAQLKQARRDRAAKEEKRKNLIAAKGIDPRRIDADKHWQEQRDAWYVLTGRRPPRWSWRL